MNCARTDVRTWNNSASEEACNGGSDTIHGWSWEGWIEIELCGRPMLSMVGSPNPYRCFGMHLPEPF